MKNYVNVLDIQFKNMFGEDLFPEDLELECVLTDLRDDLSGYNSDEVAQDGILI